VRQLLRDRTARWFLLQSVLSTFGDRFMLLAAGIWVRVLTGSNAEAGLTFFFVILPQIVVSPLAGLVADRVSRRSLLIAGQAAGAGSILLLVLVHGPGQVWLIWLVMIAYGTISTFISAAKSALLVTIVPSEQLGEANGFLNTTAEGLRLVTPLVGAGLFTLAGGPVVAELDAATYLLAMGVLLWLRVDEPAAPARAQPWLAETSAGFHHIWTTLPLRRILLASIAFLAVLGFLETAFFGVVTDGLHRPASFCGVMISIQGVGAIAGGLTAAPLMRLVQETRLTAMGMVVVAAGSVICVVPNYLQGSLPMLVVVVAALLVGSGLPWLLVGADTLIQRRTPLALQGRVDAAFGLLFGGFQAASIGVGALLIGAFGYVPSLLAVGAVGLGAAGYLISRPEAPFVPEIAVAEAAG
jgi:MFS family permease